jgi:cardiolipin synthase
VPKSNISIRVRAGAAVLACVLGLQGCATLPDAQRDMAVTPSEPVRFASAEGTVTPARSEAIIDRLEGGDEDSPLLKRHLAYEEAVNADNPLVLGNKLTLLENGPETYEAMFAAIRSAEESINLETYIFGDDEVGRQFSDALLERSSAGVDINVIYDSVGCIKTPKEFFDRLRDGGIRVIEFNPVNPLLSPKKLLKLNNRDHRKMLIVDGRIAFTGGINISDTYSSAPSGSGGSGSSGSGSSGAANSDDEKAEIETGWRDTHVRIEGPVVAEFQKLFLQTWEKQKGEPLTGKDYLPEVKPAGRDIVRAIGSTPDDPESLMYLTLMSAITHAESAVHITVAYFAPDQQLLDALVAAAARGVDVKLVLPSVSDSSAVFHLGRSYYTELLKGGVQIYERRGAVLHSKTVCIDGVWSTVGSTNLDWRSFLLNDEINAVILGRAFAGQMEAMFDDDLAESDPILLEQWEQRPVGLKLKERLARIGARLM